MTMTPAASPSQQLPRNPDLGQQGCCPVTAQILPRPGLLWAQGASPVAFLPSAGTRCPAPAPGVWLDEGQHRKQASEPAPARLRGLGQHLGALAVSLAARPCLSLRTGVSVLASPAQSFVLSASGSPG